MPVETQPISLQGTESKEIEQTDDRNTMNSTLSPALALLAPILGLGSSNTTTFASYSSQIYFAKDQTLRAPEITPNLAKIEASAKSRLPIEAYNYAAGGAGLETTIQANRDAFDHVKDCP
jgi:hypothetical protein